MYTTPQKEVEKNSTYVSSHVPSFLLQQHTHTHAHTQMLTHSLTPHKLHSSSTSASVQLSSSSSGNSAGRGNLALPLVLKGVRVAVACDTVPDKSLGMGGPSFPEILEWGGQVWSPKGKGHLQR